MSVSREVLAKYVKPGCTFIETGSRWGDTLLRAVEVGAVSAWGCEPDPLWYGICRQHVIEAHPRGAQIVVSELKSVDALGCHAAATKGDIVVFLDAHTETYSPLLDELAVIATWETKPRAILIDDVRLWSGWGISNPGVVADAIRKIGVYEIKFEDGVVPEDIMVAVRA